jgi:hypothetical protein
VFTLQLYPCSTYGPERACVDLYGLSGEQVLALLTHISNANACVYLGEPADDNHDSIDICAGRVVEMFPLDQPFTCFEGLGQYK